MRNANYHSGGLYTPPTREQESLRIIRINGEIRVRSRRHLFRSCSCTTAGVATVCDQSACLTVPHRMFPSCFFKWARKDAIQPTVRALRSSFGSLTAGLLGSLLMGFPRWFSIVHLIVTPHDRE